MINLFQNPRIPKSLNPSTSQFPQSPHSTQATICINPQYINPNNPAKKIEDSIQV